MATIRVYLKGNLIEAGKDMHSLHRDVGARPSAGFDPMTGESLWYYEVAEGTDIGKLSSALSKYPFFDRIEKGDFETKLT